MPGKPLLRLRGTCHAARFAWPRSNTGSNGDHWARPGRVGTDTWHSLMAQIGENTTNCNRSTWCNYNFSPFVDQFRMWVPTTTWYVVGLSGKFVQMNTGGPN